MPRVRLRIEYFHHIRTTPFGIEASDNIDAPFNSGDSYFLARCRKRRDGSPRTGLDQQKYQCKAHSAK